MRNISYTGIILDNKSRQLLAEKYKQMMPDGWEWIAHHMTITLGFLPKEKLDLLGTEQSITAESLGMTDMVMVIGVSGFESKNTQPHVTLAVNRKDGGKPFMSKNITDWQPIEEKFILTGQIKEVENTTKLIKIRKI
jgi:hypothetical protein